LIVGLGNPGSKYAENRHNIGFQAVDRLAQAGGLRFDEQRNKALLARGRLEDLKICLAKPQTFMNLSGEAVGPVARFYKVPPERVVVVYDDLDLPAGALRLREKGGAGGHNGMRSIIQHLGTNKFPRIRIGIGRPPGRMPAEAYVLQDIRGEERELMDRVLDETTQALRLVLREDFPAAMNCFNQTN
jgi:PTH1 family peptidyl-tRNA hydrolase